MSTMAEQWVAQYNSESSESNVRLELIERLTSVAELFENESKGSYPAGIFRMGDRSLVRLNKQLEAVVMGV